MGRAGRRRRQRRVATAPPPDVGPFGPLSDVDLRSSAAKHVRLNVDLIPCQMQWQTLGGVVGGVLLAGLVLVAASSRAVAEGGLDVSVLARIPLGTGVPEKLLQFQCRSLSDICRL